MAHSLSTHDLTAAYAGLLGVLSRLEEAREYAAAAHVVTAIELIEPLLDIDARADRSAAAADNATAFARGLQTAFGPGAEAVARRQMADADGAALVAWAGIVSQLSAHRR